jgi:hypothetical protein
VKSGDQIFSLFYAVKLNDQKNYLFLHPHCKTKDKRRKTKETLAENNFYLFTFIFYLEKAQMAKLVDALVSGTSVSNDVQVRVLFWAPKRQKTKGARQKNFYLYTFIFYLGRPRW